MNKELQKYVLTAEKIIPDTLCKKAIADINKNKKDWEKHLWYNNSKKITENKNKNKELSTIYLNNSENTKQIQKIVIDVINSYIKTLNLSWFQGWSECSSVRFNIYNKNQIMSNHCDHIHSLFDGQRKGVPVLSILGLLNDNYKGGEFIMFGDMKFKLEKGDILIFPSNFLYPHLVKPVTKGKRYSFVSWAW